ncbi:MAG: aldo/keto reductase [Bacillota bacterium]|nr:aldo/keto reductase [Bacillota bacterium]
MKRLVLGKSGIEVTELCFGALTMGPLQANMTEDKGAEVILTALKSGVNFIDTAELYRTYLHIKKALDNFDGEVVIATKSGAQTYEAMEQSVQKALTEMGRSYIDIFLLHAAKVSTEVFNERAGAWQCLLDYKAKGIIKAVGISTHVVKVVEVAAEVEEVDIVFPIINKLGMGIVGGTAEEMLAAIAKAHQAGKGLYAMKALAGGHLIDEIVDAYAYVRKIEGINSVAVGMVREEEVDLNVRLFRDEQVPPEALLKKSNANKKLIVSHIMCKGCGICAKTCPNDALAVSEGKVWANHQKCLLCGYCNPVCPEFAIRLA